MFTTDFSKAPQAAQGSYLFFGGSQYTGIRSLLRLMVRWPRVVRAMQAASGYRGHYVWYRFPFTFGNFSLWDSKESMLAFARGAEHRAAIHWLVKPGTAHAAFIRFFTAEPAGHSIGAWRAEDDPQEEWRIPRLPFSSAVFDHAP
jgi:heme-degrading monooxygenase HmoA